MKVAMVKDRLGFYEIYAKILTERGITVDLYDIWLQTEQQRLLQTKYDAFMWRAKHNPHIKKLAQRFINLYDQLGVPTFPDWHAYWLYDDKISQYYLMQKLAIATPQTWIFHRKEEALDFCETATYPLIYKSAHGAGSLNVGILADARATRKYIKRVFSKKGMQTFFKSEKQKGYAYVQQFLPGNTGDYRLVCLGDVITGFFRENRENVALASGSGKFIVDALPPDLLDFIADVHQKIASPFMAYDVMRDPQQGWVVTEFSVIHGDLHSEDLWQKTPHYHKQNNAWVQFQPKKNRHEMLMELFLHRWGWIE